MTVVQNCCFSNNRKNGLANWPFDDIFFSKLIPDLPNMMPTFSQLLYNAILKHKPQQSQTALGITVLALSFESSGQVLIRLMLYISGTTSPHC
jgi:hypothetical protein